MSMRKVAPNTIYANESGALGCELWRDEGGPEPCVGIWIEGLILGEPDESEAAPVPARTDVLMRVDFARGLRDQIDKAIENAEADD